MDVKRSKVLNADNCNDRCEFVYSSCELNRTL